MAAQSGTAKTSVLPTSAAQPAAQSGGPVVGQKKRKKNKKERGYLLKEWVPGQSARGSCAGVIENEIPRKIHEDLGYFQAAAFHSSSPQFSLYPDFVPDDLLLKAREVGAMKKPTGDDFRSVRNFYYNAKPLREIEERLSFRHEEDIVSLYQGRDEATFDRFIVKLLERFPWIQYLLCGPELRSKTDSKEIKLYSPHRIEILIGTLLAPTLSGLLALPITTLYILNISNDRQAVGKSISVLICFTLLFAGLMPFLTKAGRNEVFAASAAYCAVLVVFISNFCTNRDSNTA